MTLLPDGRFLVTGGQEMGAWQPRASQVQILDPVTETWTSTSSLNCGRYKHTATCSPTAWCWSLGARRPTGPWLSFDFLAERIEISEPTADRATWSWTATSETLNEPGIGNGNTAHRRTSTRAGGTPSFQEGGGLPFVEIFDPATGAWTMLQNSTT